MKYVCFFLWFWEVYACQDQLRGLISQAEQSYFLFSCLSSTNGQMAKNLSAMQGTQVGKIPWRQGMANPSGILA